MIAAIYARKSTQDGAADEEKSVTRQIEHARAYAEARGWIAPEEFVFVDDGISGAEFAARPGFLRLMNSLKPKPPFQVLVMSEESRLGRETIEVSYALKQLVTAGVRVFLYLADTERTLDNPMEKVMLALQTMADEMEREKARQRTKDALSRKALRGHVCGGLTFGYDNVEVPGPEGKRSHVVKRINEAEAEVIRDIFELCAAGYGKARIAKMLNERGAPCPRPKLGRPKGWAPTTVLSILQRETYRGVLVWNQSAKRDRWGQQKRQKRAEAEWVRVPAPELRIVSDEQWEAAHARLSATRANYLRSTDGRLWGRPPAGTAAKYLLTGLARCAFCGGGLEMRSRATTGKRRLYFYSCSSFYRRGKAICPNRIEIPMALADEAVIEALVGVVLTPDKLAAVAQRAVEMARAERAASPDAEARVKEQLAEVELALQRLTAAIASGGDVPALVEAIRAQESRRKALERRLEELRRPVATFDPALEAKLRAAAGEWREVLGRQVPVARQIVQKLLAEKITFKPEERDGQLGFRFEATGTLERLIAGMVPGGLASGVFPAVIPPTGPDWRKIHVVRWFAAA